MKGAQHQNTVSYRDQYTVGGLLTYAATIPGLVVLVSAPMLALAFVGGVLTALLLHRLRVVLGSTSAGTDPDAENTDAPGATQPTRQ